MLPAFVQWFLLGFLGSALVEIVTILRYYESQESLPARYQKFGYWIARFLMACGGGTFAILYEPTSFLLAIHIGASTPLLVSTLTDKLPDRT